MSEGRERDWTSIRQRLESIERALRENSEPSDAELDQIFRRRAEQLARPLPRPGNLETEIVLVFSVLSNGAGARLGIPLGSIVEVIRQPHGVSRGSRDAIRIAPVPGAPPDVAGLIQVRGEVRSVWNLGPALGLPAAPTLSGGAESGGSHSKAAGQILLLRHGTQELAVIAGQIEGALEYDAQQVRQTPGKSPGTWVTADYVTVLDVKSLFEKLQGPATS